MSQSPTSSAPLARDSEYFRNWDALGDLIKRGNSFSGRERNCVFLNTGGPRFADVSAVTGLDFVDDGRAVGLTDWDRDGDVDLWLANRTAPRLRLMRNDLPNTNQHLSFKLVGGSCNRDAIGARVELHLADSQARPLIETVRAGDGFLTQSTKWIHFGIGKAQQIRRLRVRWPGSADWEEFDALEPNARYQITQGTGVAKRLIETVTRVSLAAADQKPPTTSEASRVVLTSRVDVAEIEYSTLDGQEKKLRRANSGPVLVNLWASWCQPCLVELRDFADHRDALERAGITVVPLCTDRLGEPANDLTAAQEFLREVGFASGGGLASVQAVSELTRLQSWIFYRQRPLPLPCSFLLDAKGRLAVIYRAATTSQQVLEDVSLLDASAQTLASQVFPATGRFLFPEPGVNPLLLVRAYREGGYLGDAKKELEKTIEDAQRRVSDPAGMSEPDRQFLVSVYRELSVVESAMGNAAGVVEACRAAVRLDPNNPALLVAFAVALANQGERQQATAQLERVAKQGAASAAVHRMLGKAWLSLQDAVRSADHFSKASKLAPEDLQLQFDLGVAYQLGGDSKSAAEQFERILASDASMAMAANNLAWIYATNADESLRNGDRSIRLAEHACRLTNRQRPVFLGTLGAAYAEAGRFDEAVDTVRRAMQLAKAKGEDKLAIDLARRLRLHQQRLPYHQSGRDTRETR